MSAIYYNSAYTSYPIVFYRAVWYNNTIQNQHTNGQIKEEKTMTAILKNYLRSCTTEELVEQFNEWSGILKDHKESIEVMKAVTYSNGFKAYIDEKGHNFNGKAMDRGTKKLIERVEFTRELLNERGIAC